MNLAFYLQKIRSGKAINYAKFSELCRKHQLIGWQNWFEFQHLGQQKYQVKIKNSGEFEQLCQRYLPQESNRITAAQMGNSHQEKTSVSYFLRRTLTQPPDLIWIDSNYSTPKPQHQNAVLLENLENFAHLQQMANIFQQWQWGDSQHCSDFSADWLFAAGNQIANRLNRAYLCQYHTLYCLFDWDLGGLQIWRNLRLMLPECAVEFVLPTDPISLLQNSPRPLPTQQRSQLIEFQGISLATDKLIQAMLATGKRLEQETYLNSQEIA